MDVNTPENWVEILQKLLPQGDAIPRDPDAIFTQLLRAYALSFNRIEAAVAEVLREIDPQTTLKLLPEFEAMLGLPSICMAWESQAIDQRRAAVVAQLTQHIGQRPADYVAIAAAFGVVCTVEEFKPWTPDGACDSPIYGPDWWFALRLSIINVELGFFSAVSACDDALSWGGVRAFECAARHHQQPEMYLIFDYL